MKRLTTFAWILAVVLVFVAAAPAAEIEGLLVDKQCSAKLAEAGDGAQKAAAEHAKDCPQMSPDEASEYGVFTASNEFIAFDDAGNKKAMEALKATSKKDDLKVKVTGDRDGDKIKVSDLSLL